MFLSYAFDDNPQTPVKFQPDLVRKEIIPYYPSLNRLNYRKLAHRIYNRMIDLGIPLFHEYTEFLRQNPDEIEHLLAPDSRSSI